MVFRFHDCDNTNDTEHSDLCNKLVFPRKHHTKPSRTFLSKILSSHIASLPYRTRKTASISTLRIKIKESYIYARSMRFLAILRRFNGFRGIRRFGVMAAITASMSLWRNCGVMARSLCSLAIAADVVIMLSLPPASWHTVDIYPRPDQTLAAFRAAYRRLESWHRYKPTLLSGLH